MTPLYIKTTYSLLDSMIKIEDLINYALKHNINTLTITDNNLYGAYDFYKQCVKNNIKPIIGLEVNIDGKTLVLYAINYNGYKNLIKISTLQSEKKLTIDLLNEYCLNLILILPYDSILLYDLINAEIKYYGYATEEEKNNLAYPNKIFFKPVLYLEQSDNKYINYLHGIKDGITINQITFDYLDNSMDIYNSKDTDIFKKCNIKIIKENNLLPIYDSSLNSYEHLKKLCIEGLKKIFGTSVSVVYKERLKYELEVINKLNFCDYFLIVNDYVAYAKKEGVLVGPGRGSAAGSLVSYLLNITTIDPIKYDLIFERFLNEERITMPDIDIDFEYNRREEVVNYCINKYGFKKVAPIITFGTLASKQSIRDVGRVMDIELKIIDQVCKLLDSRLSLKQNLENEKLKNYINQNEELLKLYNIASKFEGLKRHTSIHAAGIVMSSKDLDNVIPLDKGHEFYTTGYSMEYLEELGLLKMDFLALKNLTLINDSLKEVNIDFDSIPLNDKAAYEIFEKCLTIGIFQFESTGMMNFLRKFKPNTFDDITAALALFRPGPMQNIDPYIKRRRGLEKIDYIHPDLESILKPTYGIIIFQEQIMQISSVIAGYSFAEADILRRAMSKRKEDVILSLKDEFIKRSINKGYHYDLALKVFELILKFANFGFNKAHSVSYSMIAYKMAYIKAHYPEVFLKNLLTMNIGNAMKTKDYIYEAKLLNVHIHTPDINISGSEYIIHNKQVYFPLTSIKNVGSNGAKIIESEKKKEKFKSIFDFVKRCYGKAITKKTLESLIYAGCFKDYNKKTLIENLDVIINYAEIGGLLDSEDLQPVLEIYQEYDLLSLMSFELEVFGFYLSKHPVTEYKIKHNSVNVLELELFFDKTIDIVVFIDKIKEIKTKKEDVMAFLTVSDEVATIDAVLFPKIYNEYKLNKNDILLINAKVEKRFDKYQLIVNNLKKIG